MEQYSAVLGAASAGKLPTQDQINKGIEHVLQSALVQVEQTLPDEGQLSPNGKRIAGAVRNVLEAYKQLGASKNGDNILQESLWNLTQASKESAIDVKPDVKQPAEEARQDTQHFASALRTLVNVLVTHAAAPGGSLAQDFTSFLRLNLADTAEFVEKRAAHTKETLRRTDQEVKDGKRDAVGRPIQEGQEGQPKDAQERFEKTMDTVKGVGSKTIGTTQNTTESAKQQAHRARVSISEALDHIIRRAQSDEDYQRAVRTVFGLTRKWIHKSTTPSGERLTLNNFIEDPSGRLPTAIEQLRTLVERCAGGKSLQDIFTAFERLSDSIRNDDELRQFFDEYLDFAERNIESADYWDSEEADRKDEQLKQKAKELGLGEDTEYESKRREYKDNVKRLRHELEEFGVALSRDPDFNSLKKAHLELANTVAEVGKGVVGPTGSISLSGTSWVWQDILNVYLPRVLSLFKNIPLPRTEFVSPDLEFVVENIDISSTKLLPGHAHIKQIADIDVDQPAPGAEAKTRVSGKTLIELQAVQLNLQAVSFYYHDKEHKIGPSTFTGLLDVDLPAKGIDISIALSLLPTDATRTREHRERFFSIDKVDVSISEDIGLKIKKSNHPILASTFKSVFRSTFRSALASAVTENVRLALDFIDSTAYDTHKRSKVFKDTGAPTSVAYAGAIWSEIGRLKQLPGPLSGWKMLGFGIVKDDPRQPHQFAIGTEPILLEGKKHGPQAKFTESKSDETSAAIGETLEDAKVKRRKSSAAGGEASRGVQRGMDQLRQGAEKGKSFKERVERRKHEEERREGWKSDAFEVLTTGPSGF